MKQKLAILTMMVAVALGCWSALAFYNPQVTQAYMDIVGFTDSPDGAEQSNGDVVAVGKRKEIKCWVNEAGRASLSWASTKISVYDSASGGPALTPPVQYDATTTPRSFFVEGVAVSSGVAEETLLFEALHTTPYPHDIVAFSVYAVDVTGVIPSYYADAESHVPVVFKVKGPTTVSLADLSNAEIKFRYADSFATFSIPNASVYSGDLITGNLTTPNVFTAVIKESEFDALVVNSTTETGVTLRVSYGVNVSVKGARCEAIPMAAERFGDKRIPIYEIGVKQGAANGTYNITSQISHKKECDTDGYAEITPTSNKHIYPSQVSIQGTSLDTYPCIYWSELAYGKVSDQSSSFRLEIKYDTDESAPFNGKPMRLCVLDERRRGYAMVYYPRKDCGTAKGIVDISTDQAYVHIRAFHNVDHLFQWDWGQGAWPGFEIVSVPSSAWANTLYAANIADLALTITAVANLWNALGWTAFTLDACVGIGSGVAGVLDGVPAPGEEWASVTTYAAYTVRNKEGTAITQKYFSPSPKPEDCIERINDNDGAAGTRVSKVRLDLQDAAQKVHVGELIEAFVSGSIEAGSPTGTTLFGLFDYDLQVGLTCDLSQDPTLEIYE